MSRRARAAVTPGEHACALPPVVQPGGLAGGDGARPEAVTAREIRARGLVAGLTTAQIAAQIREACGPAATTTWVRAYRLALGISLADVVAQVRAWYAGEGRPVPRFSETLLSAYESGQKRPGPEYLHYLCMVYRVEPSELGFSGPCFCGRAHHGQQARPGRSLPGPSAPTFGCAGVPVAAGGAAGVPAGDGAAGVPAGDGSAEVSAGDGSAEVSAGDGSACGAAAQPADLPVPAFGHADVRAREAGLPAPRDCGPEEDEDILRRFLLRLIGDPAATADGQFMGAADRIRRRMDDALVGGTVSVTMLDQWEETAVGYARQYMSVPPLRLLCDVLLDLSDVRRVCEHRQPLELSERLCRLSAQLAGLAGMIMIDLGDQRLARSFFRTARTAADETGDRHLRAWVAVREAMVPLYYGDPGEACALARTGRDLAGRNPCVAAAMGPVLEARAAARLTARSRPDARRGGLRRVSALLGQAHEILSRLPAAERGDAAFGYTERQLLFHEGDTLVTLGNHRGAEHALAAALRLYSPTEILDRSLVMLGLARCRLEAQEPEEALRLSREAVLGVPREHRSEIMVQAARTLGDCVAGRHGEFRAVREYRDALASA
jgi:hypothetical protein